MYNELIMNIYIIDNNWYIYTIMDIYIIDDNYIVNYVVI